MGHVSTVGHAEVQWGMLKYIDVQFNTMQYMQYTRRMTHLSLPVPTSWRPH